MHKYKWPTFIIFCALFWFCYPVFLTSRNNKDPAWTSHDDAGLAIRAKRVILSEMIVVSVQMGVVSAISFSDETCLALPKFYNGYDRYL